MIPFHREIESISFAAAHLDSRLATTPADLEHGLATPGAVDRTPQKARRRRPSAFRLRVGDWRVLYLVESPEKLLRVAAILSRGEAYR